MIREKVIVHEKKERTKTPEKTKLPWNLPHFHNGIQERKNAVNKEKNNEDLEKLS